MPSTILAQADIQTHITAIQVPIQMTPTIPIPTHPEVATTMARRMVGTTRFQQKNPPRLPSTVMNTDVGLTTMVSGL